MTAHELGKRFGDRVAFEDLSFEIARGEIFGFLGPNGAGKTTTVRTLATLLAPSAGSATVAGLALTPEHGVEIRRRIAVMPESPGLYLRLTVLENLQCFADLYEVADPDAAIDRALDAVNLAGRRHDLCGALSKGLRQRVGLARAILGEPEILFLDEPTSGLDPVAAREVHELIAALRERGATIFLTTHRLEEAERLCDRVAILNTTLRTIGRPEDLRRRLFAQSLSVRLRAALVAPERVFGGLPGVTGWRVDREREATPDLGAGETSNEAPEITYDLDVSDPDDVAPAITRALVAAGADVLSIAPSRHSLEDVYLELVGRDVEASA